MAPGPYSENCTGAGIEQYNHHFRMLYKEDVNDEVTRFMCMAYDEKG